MATTKTNEQTEKQDNRIKNITTITNVHKLTHNHKQVIFSSMYYTEGRRYYLAIAQMTSTRKVYVPCLLGVIIK